MSLASVLVKSFQLWLKSPVARQVTLQAESALAPQLAKVGAMMADELALSARAVAQVAGKSAARTATQVAGKAVAQTAGKTAAKGASQVAAKAAAEGTKATGKRVLSQGEKLIAARRVAMNRIAGDRREMIVNRFLSSKFPTAQGYRVHPEQYLRNAAGEIARDAAGKGRRLDFVVFQGDKAISTIEVTSKTASKAAQAAKELRIREAGGRYLVNPETGKLIKLAAEQVTDTLRLR